MNKLTTSTIHEIQSLAEAAGRIPGTDAAHEINKRILVLLGAGEKCSGEISELPEPVIESGHYAEDGDGSHLEQEISPDLAAELDLLRRFIAIENDCDAELKKISESMEKLEDTRGTARLEVQAAIRRITRALGSTSAWLFP